MSLEPGLPDLLAALLESLADAVYLVDADGTVRFVNAAGLQILGYDSEDELLGRPSHATIHHSHPGGRPFPEAACPLLRPRTTGETVRVDEDWFVRRDGSFVPSPTPARRSPSPTAAVPSSSSATSPSSAPRPGSGLERKRARGRWPQRTPSADASAATSMTARNKASCTLPSMCSTR
jgi:PAS domain S-box-containing protein